LYICFVQYKSSPAISVLLATIITAALAVFAYHLVEKPFITVGKRIAALIGRKATPALVETEGAGSS
jgi:peptidoglycan/LPS O-acetylase OafA/YrhL